MGAETHTINLEVAIKEAALASRVGATLVALSGIALPAEVEEALPTVSFKHPSPGLQTQLDELIAEFATKPDILLQAVLQSDNEAFLSAFLQEQYYNLAGQDNSHAHYSLLQISGAYAKNVLAFLRRSGKQWQVIAVPLNLEAMVNAQQCSPAQLKWEDTKIHLPPYCPPAFNDVLRGLDCLEQDGIVVKDIFKIVPVALLAMHHSVGGRKAGVLLSLTSLPGPFGMGDMGPVAYEFADFLANSYQRIWQMLPLNPVDAGANFSPYSSTSSVAGNVALISMELLARQGLLEQADIEAAHLPQESTANFVQGYTNKAALLAKAYQTYTVEDFAEVKAGFVLFCDEQAGWLNDYAIYTLQKQLSGLAWYEWPGALRNRDNNALAAFELANKEALDELKWQQYIFFAQWQRLKRYCNSLDIELMGDIPFYMSHDSADVWANPEIFALDKAGAMAGVAGVPPDYFSADGQLWGMPVYNIDALQQTGYKWWVQRLKKNVELFDLVRIDHFRAMADYWEVPAGQQTAVNGAWKLGPGNALFEAAKAELGSLPFVAEDLGEINPAVFVLRDAYALPGMKVVQFAFGDALAGSPHTPHNYSVNFIAYTGTHDNNTTIGWYRTEVNDYSRQLMNVYFGYDIDENNVHLALGRLAYASIAKMVILPLQDIIGLDETARMNHPSGGAGNWSWRFLPGQLKPDMQQRLRQWTTLFNRR